MNKCYILLYYIMLYTSVNYIPVVSPAFQERQLPGPSNLGCRGERAVLCFPKLADRNIYRKSERKSTWVLLTACKSQGFPRGFLMAPAKDRCRLGWPPSEQSPRPGCSQQNGTGPLPPVKWMTSLNEKVWKSDENCLVSTLDWLIPIDSSRDVILIPPNGHP